MPIFLGKNKVSCKYIIPTSDIPSSDGKKAVNFYDYDGTLLHSYTREEALELSELPSLPDRTSENLTCQGWNYVLNGYVDDGTAVSGIVNDLSANDENFAIDVGATYIPTDGATHINITFADKYRNVMPLMFTGDVTIDWGDGVIESVNHTTATTITHEYAIAQSYPAKYTIKLTVNSGTLTLGNSWSENYNICGSTTNNASNPASAYSSRIDSVFIGNGVTSIGTNAFYACYSLASVTIPNSVTSISDYAFQNCYSLASATIPNSVTSISDYAFQNCYSLTTVTIPNSVTSISDYAFQNCYFLTTVTIPNSVTSISDYAFSGCYTLAAVTIPDGVSSISNCAFQYCYSIASISIPNSVTSIGGSAFSGCRALSSISIPDGVTSIGASAFKNCYSLASVTIPNSVTSIGGSAFYSCYSLASITIPDSVSSIGGSAFESCYGIIKYDFSTHTSIPTLANTYVFSSTANDKKIVVPDALYDSWIAAENWSTYTDYIAKASEYVEP